MSKIVPEFADAIFRKGERQMTYIKVSASTYRIFLEATTSPAWRLFRSLERGAEADLWQTAGRK